MNNLINFDLGSCHQGGAGEGAQRLKPDGSVKNIQVIKTDAVLPAYCNPPNPCPLGYTGNYQSTRISTESNTGKDE